MGGDGEQQFASDNYAGICPEAIAAMLEANGGSAIAYGDDRWTEDAADSVRRLFGTDCEVFFVFNGTAANSLALASVCQYRNSVICAASPHVETNEHGAPEAFSNRSTLLVGPAAVIAPTVGGKLTPAAIRALVTGRSEAFSSRSTAVTITQPTETGQIYSVEEVAAIAATCREFGLRLHMDGARFAQACATLDATPAELTWRAGVDLMCLGGTRIGMAAGEAIVFFDRTLVRDFDFRCKQAGQLASKMRFLSAPWRPLLGSGVWLRNARHANICARRLADQIVDVAGVELLFPIQSNAVFLSAPADVLKRLRARGWRFYTFIGGGARFMFAWDSDPARIDRLARDIRDAAASGSTRTGRSGSGSSSLIGDRHVAATASA